MGKPAAKSPAQRKKLVQYTPGEVQKMFGNTDMMDLVAAFAIYRECIRLGRKYGGDASEYCKWMADDWVNKSVWGDSLNDLLESPRFNFLKMATSQGAESASGFLRDVFGICHFTNVFHQNDRQNQLFRQLSGFSSQANVAFAALLYFTGNRLFTEMFIEKAVAELPDHANMKSASADKAFMHIMYKHMLDSNNFAGEAEDIQHPTVFHRRYRPMLLWDNEARAIMAICAARGKTGPHNSAQDLYAHAEKHLVRFAKPLVNEAREVAKSQNYCELYNKIRECLPPTDERDFHAKNIANLLEEKVLGRYDDESSDNGLGPGFRQFAHIRNGFGKVDKKMSVEELKKELDFALEQLQARWPTCWTKKPLRRRHVQSIYCEMQKLLSYFRNGMVPTTCVRLHRQPSLASIRRLQENKKKAAVQKWPGKSRGAPPSDLLVGAGNRVRKKVRCPCCRSMELVDVTEMFN